ncbi:hypothetical protein PG988_001961 [Apiospora saccharicola]
MEPAPSVSGSGGRNELCFIILIGRVKLREQVAYDVVLWAALREQQEWKSVTHLDVRIIRDWHTLEPTLRPGDLAGRRFYVAAVPRPQHGAGQSHEPILGPIEILVGLLGVGQPLVQDTPCFSPTAGFVREVGQLHNDHWGILEGAQLVLVDCSGFGSATYDLEPDRPFQVLDGICGKGMVEGGVDASVGGGSMLVAPRVDTAPNDEMLSKLKDYQLILATDPSQTIWDKTGRGK